MLRDMLGQHSGLYSVPGETKFFVRFEVLQAQYPDLRDRGRLRDLLHDINAHDMRDDRWRLPLTPEIETVILDRLQAAQAQMNITPGHVFGALADAYAAHHGYERWVEKTPTHIGYVPLILETFPEARIIIINRDPRDICASKKTRRQTVWTRHPEEQRQMRHMTTAYHPVWDTLSWLSLVKAGMDAAERYPDQVMVVRYEDLVQDPETHLRQLADFIDLPYQVAMASPPTRNAADQSAVQDQTTVVYKGSVSRWLKVLNGGEVSVIQTIAGRTMQRSGFDLVALRPVARLRGAAIFLMSPIGLFVRLYRRWRAKGFGFVAGYLREYRHRLRLLKRRG